MINLANYSPFFCLRVFGIFLLFLVKRREAIMSSSAYTVIPWSTNDAVGTSRL